MIALYWPCAADHFGRNSHAVEAWPCLPSEVEAAQTMAYPNLWIQGDGATTGTRSNSLWNDDDS